MIAPYTADELLELPLVIDLEAAGKAFGLGRYASFQLAERDEFPVPVMRFGRFYRVRRADLLDRLGIIPTAV